MNMDLYIYYRVKSGRHALLQSKISAMQARIASEHGVLTALKRRPEEENGQQTWMEIYHAIPEGFDRVLAPLVIEAELATLIDGERHLEYFMDLSPCA
jgi:hypothetical protein